MRDVQTNLCAGPTLISYTVASLIFLSPFAGYAGASAVNNQIHVKLGQRGIALIWSSCHLVYYIFLALHPSYPALVVLFAIVGVGNGPIDGAWCAFVGSMERANHIGTHWGRPISPLVATALITQASLRWYGFYYIMGLYVLEFLTSACAFWKQTGRVDELENPRDPSSNTGRTREALRNRLAWVLAVFVFCYVGCEVSLGGWVTTFTRDARHVGREEGV